MAFNLKTLNGRFALMIITLSAILIIFAIYSFVLVKASANHNYSKIQKNTRLSFAIHEVIEEVRKTETSLHQYSTFLSQEKLEQVDHHLFQAVQAVQDFVRSPDLQENPGLLSQAKVMQLQVGYLKETIIEYKQIMQRVESRYPGMPILLENMEPLNQKFSESVELALQDGDLTGFRPNVIANDVYSIMQLFQEVRYAWSMQISWFRIFVANRMGAFGEPEKAMRNNLENRKMFAQEVVDTLTKLDVYNDKGMLSLQQEESLRAMHEIIIAYNDYLNKAVEVYYSENWRADVSLLRNTLQPTMNLVLNTAESIEKTIYESNQLSISNSLDTANTLSLYIIVFTAIIFIMLLLAYWVFQKKIREPVLRLSEKMQHDPLGSNLETNKLDSAEEIANLIDSYNAMRLLILHRQQRLESILNNAAEGIITIDERGKIETFNTAAQSLFAYRPEEIIGHEFGELLSTSAEGCIEADIAHAFKKGQLLQLGGEQELRGKRKDGREFVMSFKISDMFFGDKRLFTAMVDDITERRAVMDHLQHLAEHDSLTSLYNRQYFNNALEREFERCKRHKQILCACLYIDLDNFKYINDTLGHLQGDRLLVGIANTLATRTRKSDILARLGGDEFALILIDIEVENIQKVANMYRESIANYNFAVAGKHIDTGCSIGVAIYDDTLENKDALLARADVACHMAKRAGRNRVHIFENKDKDKIDLLYKEMGWTRRIRFALENDDFVFSCQPILNVATGTLYSHELLLRMRDQDTNEYIMPSGFFDSAERFGLMPEIDRWVVEHAFDWLNNQPLDEGLCYFINLSGKSIGDPDVLAVIRDGLQGLKIEPQRVVFEITEDVAIAELDKASHFLTELRTMGFKTALDDFGVGYSSFSYLRELDVDFVKIDGSFINSMHEDELNFALVKAINDICHILGKKTIAEYVQNQQALLMLRDIGVDYAQGYNIAIASDYDQATIQFRLASQ